LQSAWKRAGLYGPFEYSVNYENSNKYNNKIEAGLKTATGPSFDDVYDAVVHAMGYDTFRGPAGVVFERMPFATLLRKLFPEKYKEFQKEFRKIDKETAGYLGPKGFDRKQKPNPYVPLFSKGGIVEGEDNVPFTKEDPADRVDPFTGEPYQEQMDRLGFKHGGPHSSAEQYSSDPFIQSIITIESSANPNAESPVGAKGLMQLMEDTARQPGYGVKPFQGDNLFDPKENVRFGTDYINAMIKKYGNKKDAAVAYNWGPVNTNRWIKDGSNIEALPKETQNYLTKLKNLGQLD